MTMTQAREIKDTVGQDQNKDQAQDKDRNKPVVQLHLQGGSVGPGSGGLQDTVEHVALPPRGIGAQRAVRPPIASVIRQQRVGHQVHRLGPIGEALKQQLGLAEVEPAGEAHRSKKRTREPVGMPSDSSGRHNHDRAATPLRRCSSGQDT